MRTLPFQRESFGSTTRSITEPGAMSRAFCHQLQPMTRMIRVPLLASPILRERWVPVFPKGSGRPLILAFWMRILMRGFPAPKGARFSRVVRVCSVSSSILAMASILSVWVRSSGVRFVFAWWVMDSTRFWKLDSSHVSPAAMSWPPKVLRWVAADSSASWME